MTARLRLDIANALNRDAEGVFGDAVGKASAYTTILSRSPLPFMQLPSARFQFEEMRHILSSFPPGIKNLVVLGIGGSSLGTQAIINALLDPALIRDEQQDRTLRSFVLDNIDPHTMQTVVKLITPERDNTLLLVISKSGDTSETIAQFMIFRELLGQHARDRIILITDAERGHLKEIAQKEGYRVLNVPDGIGGRFSVLTPVGLFPSLLLGIDIDQLLLGAEEMRQHIASAGPDTNMAIMLAALLYAAERNEKNVHVMMPYCDRLSFFTDWFRQLEAESLGKGGLGPTPLKCIGVTDQHSQLQLFMEGPKDKFVIFLYCEDSTLAIPLSFPYIDDLGYLAGNDLSALFRAEFQATSLALTKAGIPNVTITLKTVDAFNLGALFFLFEVVVAIMGHLYGINAFDQPGVEQGKIYTKALMGKKGYEEEAVGVAEQLRRPRRTIDF